jgi:Protein of unknown function (DUF1524)/Protein of unknown function DUF262
LTGRQRLTTLILLLKAIEKTLDNGKKIEKKAASDLADLLVKPDTDALLLLQTNHDTSHYFANYLRTGKHPDLHAAKTLADRELLRAIRQCEEFVAAWKNNDSAVELFALLKNKLTFVLHEIEDERIAYTTFEVLNSRGLEVSHLDRLKSSLMGAAFELKSGNKIEIIDELHRTWADIYRCIGLRQGMDTEALRFAATLATDKSPSKPLGEKDALETLKEPTTARKISETANWLLMVTKACDALKRSRRINAVTRISQARLVAAALNLRTDIDDKERRKLFRIWESVTFRIYGLYGKDARTRVGNYIRLAWRIWNERLASKAIARELTQIGEEFPVGGAVDELRKTDCYSDWSEELRYLMYRYEEHLAKEAGQKFLSEQWERIWEVSAADSIEHIWPQSKAPDSQVHRLGNLVLLPPNLNSKLQALDPQKKADAYIKSGLLIAQEVAAQLKRPWKTGSIDEREEALLEWAMEEWGDTRADA